VNLYIEKIMKINKQSWSVLTISGKEIDRNIFTSYAEKIMLGCEHNMENSILYFEKYDIDKVNIILNNLGWIDNWEWSEIKEKNWNQKCKDFFKPVIVDKKVEIIPYWEKTTDDYLSIKINPALAFGTGHHETTYMMMQAILKFDLNGKSIFDIGTGSGILSILAKKRGARNIVAIDNDKLTYNNFYENLDLNNINEDIEFKITDCLNVDNFKYDFIFANININVLLNLVSRINTKGTILILSGILSTDEELVSKVLNPEKIQNIYRKKEWLCLVVKL